MVGFIAKISNSVLKLMFSYGTTAHQIKVNVSFPITLPEPRSSQVYQCHRVYLAKSSPVLATMLYQGKDKVPQDHISLPDIQPAAFNQVLR